MDWRPRLAREDDISRLEALIPISVKRLQAHHYSRAQMEAAFGSVFGADRQLIRDETYFVVEREKCELRDEARGSEVFLLRAGAPEFLCRERLAHSNTGNSGRFKHFPSVTVRSDFNQCHRYGQRLDAEDWLDRWSNRVIFG